MRNPVVSGAFRASYVSPVRWFSIGAVALLALAVGAQASTAVFFRVTGPSTTQIARVRSGGDLLWTNPVLSVTCNVQVASSLAGDGDWHDYQHSMATGAWNSATVFDSATPTGMAYVPAGFIVMGDVSGDHASGMYGELNEDPTHKAQLAPFYIGTHEVSQGEWDTVRTWALSHGYTIPSTGNGKAADHPVANVSWYDAVLWCNAKSEMDGLTPCYYTDASQATVYRSGSLNLASNAVKWSANGYRLPCEAEWEYAARGGAADARFAFGDTISHTQANYYSDASYGYDVSATRGRHPDYSATEPCTCPCGALHGNGYGLCEVAGNVSEWCWDLSDGKAETCGTCGGSGYVNCSVCGGSGAHGCPNCGGGGMVMCGSCSGAGFIDVSCSNCGGSGNEMCTACNGSGSVGDTCGECGGGGMVMCPNCTGLGQVDCSTCSGLGQVDCTQCSASGEIPCPTCGGEGNITCSGCGGAGCDVCGWTGQVTCPNCSGSGSVTCPNCSGSGQQSCPTCSGSGQVNCPACSGSGGVTCGTCGGSGTVPVTCGDCGGSGSVSCDVCGGAGHVTGTCPTCSGSGGVSCSQCGGSGEVSCENCGGSGTFSCSTCGGVGSFWFSDYYTLGDMCDPHGPDSGSTRIVRGGSWASDADMCRVSVRDEAFPGTQGSTTGFRVVRSAAK